MKNLAIDEEQYSIEEDAMVSAYLDIQMEEGQIMSFDDETTKHIKQELFEE